LFSISKYAERGANGGFLWHVEFFEEKAAKGPAAVRRLPEVYHWGWTSERSTNGATPVLEAKRLGEKARLVSVFGEVNLPAVPSESGVPMVTCGKGGIAAGGRRSPKAGATFGAAF
jgi:hypothetical protein